MFARRVPGSCGRYRLVFYVMEFLDHSQLIVRVELYI